MKEKPIITYFRRGRVERGPRYDWAEGYSENSAAGNPTYPWMTRLECIADAKKRGAQARFNYGIQPNEHNTTHKPLEG